MRPCVKPYALRISSQSDNFQLKLLPLVGYNASTILVSYDFPWAVKKYTQFDNSKCQKA